MSAATAAALFGGLALMALLGRRSGSSSSYDPNVQAQFINGFPDRLRPVQTALVALGYDAPESGAWDLQTQRAFAQYSADRGLPSEPGITPAREYAILQEALPYLSGSGAAEYYYGGGSGGSSGGATVDMDPLGGAIVRNGSTIATLQNNLYSLGYNPGRYDGVADMATIAAMNQFLRDDGALSSGAQPYTSITDAMVRLVAQAAASGRLVSDPSPVRGIDDDARRTARVASVVRQSRIAQRTTARRRY